MIVPLSDIATKGASFPLGIHVWLFQPLHLSPSITHITTTPDDPNYSCLAKRLVFCQQEHKNSNGLFKTNTLPLLGSRGTNIGSVRKIFFQYQVAVWEYPCPLWHEATNFSNLSILFQTANRNNGWCTMLSPVVIESMSSLNLTDIESMSQWGFPDLPDELDLLLPDGQTLQLSKTDPSRRRI